MTRRRPGQTLLLLAVLAILGGGVGPGPGTRPAMAAERTGTEKAREHFQHGEAFFKLEKYKEALSEYEQGYIAKSDASFLYNIAQCHRLMGNKTAALRFYRRFLTEGTKIPNREMVEQHIRDLEKAIGKTPASGGATGHPTSPPAASDVASSSPAHPTTDGLAPASGSSAASTPATSPAPVDLSATAPTTESAPIIIDTPTSSPATSGDDTPIYKRWWFWTAIGAVALAGGITTVVLLHKSPTCETGRTCM